MLKKIWLCVSREREREREFMSITYTLKFFLSCLGHLFPVRTWNCNGMKRKFSVYGKTPGHSFMSKSSPLAPQARPSQTCERDLLSQAH